MAIRSPLRACARAKVHAHNRPYVGSSAGRIVSVFTEPFQSRSWRT
jgi:hypothetical protein